MTCSVHTSAKHKSFPRINHGFGLCTGVYPDRLGVTGAQVCPWVGFLSRGTTARDPGVHPDIQGVTLMSHDQEFSQVEPWIWVGHSVHWEFTRGETAVSVKCEKSSVTSSICADPENGYQVSCQVFLMEHDYDVTKFEEDVEGGSD